MSVDLPIPLVVTRHQCPHCRRTHSKKAATVAHMGRCWRNPAVRGCKSCEHHLPAYSGEPCNPGEWCQCGESPEGCDVDAVPAGTQFPIINCPKWEAKV